MTTWQDCPMMDIYSNGEYTDGYSGSVEINGKDIHVTWERGRGSGSGMHYDGGYYVLKYTRNGGKIAGVAFLYHDKKDKLLRGYWEEKEEKNHGMWTIDLSGGTTA